MQVLLLKTCVMYQTDITPTPSECFNILLIDKKPINSGGN